MSSNSLRVTEIGISRVHTVSEYPRDFLYIVKHHPIKTALWVVGLLVYFLASASSASEAETTAYLKALPTDGEYAALFQLEREAIHANNALKNSYSWFGFVCDGDCPALRDLAAKADAAEAAAKAVVQSKEAAATKELPLISAEAIDNMRERWNSIWGSGKKTAAGLSQSSAQWHMLSMLFSSDRPLMEVVAQIVMETIMWILGTMFFSCVYFSYAAWNICWSYKGSIFTAIAVWGLATLAASMYLATLVGSFVMAGNVAIRLAAGTPRPALEGYAKRENEHIKNH
jgi:hypothetical protein